MATGLCHALVLTSSKDGVVCPEELLKFTCNISSPYGIRIRWDLKLGGQKIDDLSLLGDVTSGSLNYQDHLFNATLLSTSPNILSTLTTTAVEELDGVIVECIYTSTMMEMKQLQVASR